MKSILLSTNAMQRRLMAKDAPRSDARVAKTRPKRNMKLLPLRRVRDAIWKTDGKTEFDHSVR